MIGVKGYASFIFRCFVFKFILNTIFFIISVVTLGVAAGRLHEEPPAVDGEGERMSALQDRDRSRWIPIFEKHFATAECGLRLGEMQETAWHTILAELIDKKGDVFLLAEVDFDTQELLRCRRPSGAAGRA